jgi:hypothetical protein
MPLPDTRTFTAKFTDTITGQPLEGKAVFDTIPSRWTDRDNNQMLLTDRVRHFDQGTDGAISIALVTTDENDDILPVENRFWSMQVEIDGEWQPYIFTLPAGEGPIDLTDVEVITDPTTGTTYVPVPGPRGEPGATGPAGESAYDVAVDNGFEGTESQWLTSLHGTAGTNGADGDSAYEIAVSDGFVGTEEEWLASLQGPQGEPGGIYEWRFNIEDFGAVPDTQIVMDATVVATVAAVTCSTSHPFVSGDVGKVAIIMHGGVSGLETFATLIAAVNDSSTAILEDAPPTSVTNGTLYFGTNAYDAQNAATDAAEEYLRGTGTGAASRPHTYAQVWTPNNAYITHGPLQTSKEGYGQVVYGVFDETEHKVTIDYCGVSPAGASVRHWEQLVPQGGGSCWISTFLFTSTTASNNNQDPTSKGIAGVISGPNEGQTNGSPWGSLPVGRDTPIYTNVFIMVRNMSFLTAYSSLGANIGFLNAYGTANYMIENVSEGALAIVDGSSDLGSPAAFSASFGVAMIGSSPGNNDLCYIKNLSLHGGHAFGAWISEHTLVDRYMCLYSWVGLVMVGSYAGSVGTSHAAKVSQASIEACTHELYFMGPGAQGITMLDIDQLQTEDGHPNITGSSAPAIAAACGTVKWTGLFDADQVKAQLTDGTETPCGILQVNGQVPRPIRRVSANYTVKALDRTIMCDTTSADITVTLPSPNFNAVEYAVRNNVGSNVVHAGGADLAASESARYQAYYDGSGWAWAVI